MNSNNAYKSSRPDLLSWLAAGLSLALTGAAIIFSAGILEDHRIRSEIKELTEDPGEEFLTRAAYILKPSGSAALYKTGGESLQFESLNRIKESLVKSDTESAAREFSLLNETLPAQFGETTARIKSLLSELNENMLKFEALNQKAAALDSEAKEELVSFSERSRELYSFFGLPYSDPETMAFYENGLLAGLPAVSGLPDKIQNVEEFASKLSSLGGAITFPEGVNAQAFFAERLEALKDSSFNLYMGHLKREKELSQLDPTLDSLGKSLNEHTQITLTSLKELGQKLLSGIP